MFYACSSDFRVWSPCDEFFSLEQVALRKRSPCLYKVQNLPIPKKPWNNWNNMVSSIYSTTYNLTNRNKTWNNSEQTWNNSMAYYTHTRYIN